MTDPVGFARLSVDISKDNVEALDSVCAHDGVTVPAATRLLLRLGYLVYSTIKIEGNHILIHDGKKLRNVKLPP